MVHGDMTGQGTADQTPRIIVLGQSEWSSTSTTAGSSYLESVGIEKKDHGINPNIYFKWVKGKFRFFEKRFVENRLKKIEAAFNKACENGQDALAEKFMREIVRETKESMMYAKGVKYYIKRDDLNKYKHKIRGGHIQETRLEDYIRVIPEKVLKKKKDVEGIFDKFVIYHYWSDQAKDVETMTPKEKEKMKDPVLFGMIEESDRLYFVDDWEDEFCDLTFNEIIEVMGKDEDDCKIPKNPVLNV